MTLDEKIRQALNDGPPGLQRLELLLSDDGWTATLTVDKQDELSCLLWEIKVHHAAAAVTDLRSWADVLVGRVTTLFQPIKVFEVDILRQQAILRSDKTTRRKDVQFYFEVFLDGTTVATVRRFQVPLEGQHKREQTSFALTHEGLIKLVADLTSR